MAKLLADPIALQAVCHSLYTSEPGGLSRERLRKLTREVVSNAGTEDEASLQELVAPRWSPR